MAEPVPLKGRALACLAFTGIVAIVLGAGVAVRGAAAQDEELLPRIALPGLAYDGPAGPAVSIIGESVNGRPIEAFSLGDGPLVIVLVGGIHAGFEDESVHIVEELFAHFVGRDRDLAPELRLIVIPRANPDGYATGSRFNANRVDLNRNWPTDDWMEDAQAGDEVVSGGTAPLSEPETRALHDYLAALKPFMVLSYHGFGSLVESNAVVSGETALAFELAEAYAAATGFEHILEWPFYPVTGQFIDAMEDLGVAAADVELALDDDLPFERNLGGLEALIERALELYGAGVR